MRIGYVLAAVLVACLLAVATLFYRTNHDEMLRGTFGGVSLRIDVASTTAERELGLGGRTAIPNDYGMLFIFDRPDTYGFWMKDMQVPIDIFWLDGNGQVVSKKEHVSPDTYPDVFYPTAPATSVLETRAGFGEAHDIATGTPLLLQKSLIVSQ